MGDSFDPPSGTFNLNASGQRVWVADYSGLPIETQFYSGERFVKAWISGQAVTTSVNVSLSGVALNVSGNVVYLTSGQNPVQNSGQVVYLVSGHNEIQGSFTANVSGQPVRVSGDTVIALISGQTVVANVVTNISGQTVYLASGNNNVQMSGQTVVVPFTSISGNVVVVPSTSISGNAVRISGETVQIAGGINVSGSPVRVSGETVHPVSGKAFMYGFDESGATWNEVFMDTSGGHRIKVAISGDTVQIAGGVSVSGNVVLISGQTIQIAGGINVSGSPVRVSGETVYLVSGQNAVQMSGQTVVVPFTSVSGNMVSISGQAVSISGNVVVASVTTNISGQVVYLVSGQNPVQLYGYDPSGEALRPLIVNASGSNILRVDAGSINVSANVSGNAVRTSGQVAYLVSGNNDVQISGQVVLISGQTVVASVTTNISGQTVYLVSGNNDVQISGQTVQIAGGVSVSGNAVRISGSVVLVSGQLVAVSGLVATSVSGNAVATSGQVVYLTSGQNEVLNYGFIAASGQWGRMYITQSGQLISGTPHKVVVTFSGDSIIGSVSGNMVSVSGQPVSVSGNVVLVSGQTVSVSGLIGTSVSGNVVYLASGQNDVQISGQVVLISGQTVVASVTTNISGQTVYTASGNNNVQMSGQTVRLISGGVLIFDGQDGSSSAASVQSSLSTVGTGDNSLSTIAHLYGYSRTINNWRAPEVTQSGQAISGVLSKLIVGFSGDTATISGNAVQISGQLVAVSGLIATSVSGNMVSVSGQNVVITPATLISGEAVRVSGQIVYLTSGQNDVGAFGLIDASGQLTRLRVTQSGQLISGIPHKLVVTFSGDSIIGSVSGNAVLISGQLVAVSGTVAASVSGNMVSISGQPVSVSGNVVVASVTTNISGQTVYLASGFNPVQLYGLDQSGQQLMPLIVNQSGGNVLRVDAGAINVASNVSGNVVYLASGQNAVQMSGQGIRIADATIAEFANVLDDIGDANSATNNGLVVAGYTLGYDPDADDWKRIRADESGYLVPKISGQVVLISGQTVVASVTTNISGQTVYTASGNNEVKLMAMDLSGNQLLPLATSASGKNRLAVAIYDVANQNSVTVGSAADNESSAAALKTRALLEGYDFVNDQFVRARVTASGQGMSGIHHKLAVTFSGDSIIGSVSGNAVAVSGQAIIVSGAVKISNNAGNVFVGVDNVDDDTFSPGVSTLFNTAFNLVYEHVTDNWVRLRATASGRTISGIHHKLVVTFSGDSIIGSVSGNMVSVSGQPVSVSGNMVSISGQFVDISGEIIQPRVPVQIRTRDTLLITGASGGVALLSGDVLRVTVRNIGISGTVMYVGGSGDYPWVASGQTYPMFSGRGFWLRDGDGVTIQTSNMAFVRVVSHTSGQYVSYIGEQY